MTFMRAPAGAAIAGRPNVARGFHSASIQGTRGSRCDQETALQSQAQHRTRTDDPFLTMEVLYQLS